MRPLQFLAEAGSSPWLPPQASTSAKSVDSALSFVFWISAFFFVLIVALMLVFVIRYRQRKAGEMGEGATSHLGIELVWTGIPILVVASIFWVGFRAFLDLATPPEHTYDINVTAQKWNWLFTYPNGWVDSELHVPVDTAVLLNMRSQDVIHSFYVPAFRTKKDVVPGRINQVWFEADRIGEYNLFCAEYCGTGHSDMITKVVVHEPGGFEKWLKQASSLLSPAFKPTDVLDLGALGNRVKNGDRPVDAYVRENIGADATAALAAWAAGSPVPDDLAKALVDGLNEIMKSPERIWTEERFAGVALSDDTKALLAREDLAGEDLMYLNRYLLADAYPDALRRNLDFVGAGEQIYAGKGGCKQCHSLDGSVGVGPSFKGLFGHEVSLKSGGTVTADESYLEESIRRPDAKVVAGYQAVMPVFGDRLKDREIDALIAFIKSLSEKKEDE